MGRFPTRVSTTCHNLLDSMARWGQCGGTGAGACPSDLAGLAAIVGDLLEVAVRGIHARAVGVRFALLAVWLSLLSGRAAAARVC